MVPNEQILISTLKSSYKNYSVLCEKLLEIKPDIKIEWKYFGKKNGWLLKHLDKKRNLFFLVPYDGSFKISFTFGDKAISHILSSETVSDGTKELIRTSKKYAEGTSFLVSGNSRKDIRRIIELIKAKLWR